MPKPWYIDGFGRHYLELYAHRNEREAAEAIALLEGAGLSLAGRRILDLGCGAGRHLQILRRRGARAFGLDLSWPLLDEARRHTGPGLALLRGDMRALPLRDACLDAVLSMFTSFGYFHGDEENWRVLEEVARVLAPGGAFLFDFLNRRTVELRLQAASEKRGRRWQASESRRIEGDRVIKAVEVREQGSGAPPLRYEESVRLFRPQEIRDRLGRLGFLEANAWGNYAGEVFDEASSPRFILFLRKKMP